MTDADLVERLLVLADHLHENARELAALAALLDDLDLVHPDSHERRR